MKKYVVGFLFSNDCSHVVLIKKLNPKWQKGLFNGVGGKIEEGESSIEAISREFEEETGVLIDVKKWNCYINIQKPSCYYLDVYCAFSDLAFEARSVEKEEVHIVKVNNLPNNIIPNLKWLIPLALDNQVDFSAPLQLQLIA